MTKFIESPAVKKCVNLQKNRTYVTGMNVMAGTCPRLRLRRFNSCELLLLSNRNRPLVQKGTNQPLLDLGLVRISEDGQKA